jgi:predicted enzyme related to lactoylglutathione lyase
MTVEMFANQQKIFGVLMSLSPFHLAIPVYDLAAARTFYGEVFGLEVGAPARSG